MRVDGSPVGVEAREVWAVNKPAGVVSTAREPGERPAVVELVDSPARLYPVGRLDADSTGLLLLTNDGELANRLTHPRYGVAKTYRARLGKPPRDRDLERLRAGVELEDGATAPAEVTGSATRKSRSSCAKAATARCGGWSRRSATGWSPCAASGSAPWRSAAWPKAAPGALRQEIARLSGGDTEGLQPVTRAELSGRSSVRDRLGFPFRPGAGSLAASSSRPASVPGRASGRARRRPRSPWKSRLSASTTKRCSAQRKSTSMCVLRPARPARWPAAPVSPRRLRSGRTIASSGLLRRARLATGAAGRHSSTRSAQARRPASPA